MRTQSQKQRETPSQQEQLSHRHRKLRGRHTVHTSSTPTADSRLQPPGRVRLASHSQEHNHNTVVRPNCGPTPDLPTWLRNQCRARQ
ncbi:hypothetical protein Taro_027283 [Colocasia esculenta]|uniref:Uncharacterized protein n=1 Tax=Colocasia esculenta TaxID=4460 RepID=A0A843VFB7_COLES|nr:hypothetical protein [Colocasia esculenta]